MQIHGLNKTTLLDYPEHVAATLFTGYCNFRCPFCHNMNLVLRPEQEQLFSEDEIFSFLEKRRHLLSGVCITGGEPTLQKDLKDFIRHIKALGYAVKLDTNGYQPDTLADLYAENLLDYVAMDIKNAPDCYAQTIGLCDNQFDIKRIESSISLIKEQSVDYEFRTTVVRELHTLDNLLQIAQWIGPCKRYYLQCYRDNEHIINPVFSAYPADTFAQFKEALLPLLPNIEIRGIDILY